MISSLFEAVLAFIGILVVVVVGYAILRVISFAIMKTYFDLKKKYKENDKEDSK